MKAAISKMIRLRLTLANDEDTEGITRALKQAGFRLKSPGDHNRVLVWERSYKEKHTDHDHIEDVIVSASIEAL